MRSSPPLQCLVRLRVAGRVGDPLPGEDAGQPGDLQRRLELVAHVPGPRVEVGVAQAGVVPVVRPQRDEQRREGVADDGVAPVEDRDPPVRGEDVAAVEVVVLQGRRQRQLRTQLLEPPREPGQPRLPEPLERRGKRLDPLVGNAGGEVLGGVRGLALLELGVERQGGEPGVLRVAERTDGRPGVSEEQERARLVPPEQLRQPVGPAGGERRGQRGLVRLHRPAVLEPGRAALPRDAPDGRPGQVVHELRRARPGEPVDDGGIHVWKPSRQPSTLGSALYEPGTGRPSNQEG